MRRATRTAAASPSSANGTSFSEGCEPRTNVIRGCTEATAAPRLRNEASSSLPSAPLECNATLPFHSICFAIDSAAAAIAESGTQNQTNSACTEDKSFTARAPTCSASLCAVRQRSSATPRNHDLDRISRDLQRPRKRRPQIPRPHNRDSRLPCHARQHSRTAPHPTEVRPSAQRRTFESRPNRSAQRPTT